MKYFFLLACLVVLPSSAKSQTWPTYRNDFGRSGYAQADIDASRLQLKWEWKSELPPQPAWDGPARWDAFAELKDLPAMRQYDACFHPICDQNTVYFGSSSQDSLFALDRKSGKQKWIHVAGGPIRIAPTIFNDRILFGCDDGFAYCVDKQTGKLIWKFSPSAHAKAEQRNVLNDDRLISFYPIRSGIVTRDNVAYFAASFMPWRESYLCGINIDTGHPDIPKKTFVTRHENATLEGPLLIAEGRLIVPQGRIAPLLFDRNNGNKLGNLPGGGGVTIVLTEDGDVARAEGGRAARPGQVGVFKGKERVASFPRGRSIVVRPNAFYVVDREKVFAASRKANELLWQLDFDEPLEIIMVGNNLIVGGRDQVSAIHAKTGKIEWQANVDGRVFGLAYANGLLVASSDTGNVYGFQADAAKKWTAPKSQVTSTSAREQIPVASLNKQTNEGLQHRWVFHRSEMKTNNGTAVTGDKLGSIQVKDLAGRAELTKLGNAKSIPVGTSARVEAIELGDAMFPIEEEIAKNLPKDQISVTGWVRVDKPTTWGGIVGCIQDDGSTEHGWLLGYNGNKFSFAVAGSKVGLTYLAAQESFNNGNWYHVAGTYDGKTMKLFVNGKLAATSTAESGPISYAAKKYFTVGAYKDANESFPLKGAIHEIRIYGKSLDPSLIESEYKLLAAEFKSANKTPAKQETAVSFLSWGPYVRFVRPGTAEITYGTKKPVPTVVELLASTSNTRRNSDPAKKTTHKIELNSLPHKRLTSYRISDSFGEKSKSQQFALDTHFDWSRNKMDNSASPLLAQLPNPKGLAFVFGKEHEELAKRISRQSQLTVIFFADDKDSAQKLRQQWMFDKSVRYGNRLSVSTLNQKQLPAATAQLVILPKTASAETKSLHARMVRPSGGVLSDGEKKLWTRGKVKGGGDWTHMYGLPDNSAFGGEELGDASNRDDLVANWIGKPGPRYQTDRQNRKPAPLAANGRLFLQGQQRMIAMDSFSGTILWSVESPTVMRWNVPRDSANWCADDNGLFVAADKEAWFLDGRTGEIQKKFQIPDSFEKKKDTEYHWGFIARHKDLLVGSAVQADAVYKKWWGKTQWFDSPTGGDTHLVACDSFFALDHKTGVSKWKYDGLVFHPTITILDNRIYFVEDKTPEHKTGRARRISLDAKQQHELVCLNAETGKQVFRKKLDPFKGKVSALYLAGGGNQKLKSLILVASEATQKVFAVTCLDPITGDKKWNRPVKWEANHHGKHISRPALENDLIYLRPEVMKLADGTTIKRGFPSGHGCASYTLSKNGLFSRLGETTWWDVRNDKVNRFSRVRTDCWISAIPAQGMLLSAEGGGGCSCGSWLETSIGFLPRKIDQTFPEFGATQKE